MFLNKLTALQRTFIYTDASFNLTKGLAVSGFLFFETESAHNKSEYLSSNIETLQFNTTNNIRAELIGALHCLQKINNEVSRSNIDIKYIEINLYSDCQTLTNLLKRRENLIKKNFISDQKKTELANADLYKEFYKIYDVLKPNIYWVKGHSKAENQNIFQKNFQIIDQIVRKELRIHS